MKKPLTETQRAALQAVAEGFVWRTYQGIDTHYHTPLKVKPHTVRSLETYGLIVDDKPDRQHRYKLVLTMKGEAVLAGLK